MVLDFNDLTLDQNILFNQSFFTNKTYYNDLIGGLLKITDTQTEIEWLVSLVASRHTYQSKLYQNIVELILAEDLMASLQVSKIIFTSEIIRRTFLKNHPGLTIETTYSKKNQVTQTLLKDLISDLLILLRGMLSRNTVRRNMFGGKRIKLIETFILSNSIKAGEYIDRYYNGLWDSISDKEKEKIFFLPEILGRYSSKDILRISKHSKVKFLFKQDFLNLKDYLKALKKLIRVRYSKKEPLVIRNIDVTAMVRHELLQTRIHPSAYKGMLNYYFARKLKAKINRLDLFIDWNENQPIDKGLVKGIRAFHPGTPIKGYQGYIVSTNFNFYIQPTDFEVENGVIPDEICVVGDGLKQRISEFSNKINVVTAPAFRFQGVFMKYEKKTDGTKKIMVALPIGEKESYYIMAVVSKAHVLLGKEKPFKILIKPHPVLNINKLRTTMGSMWCQDFQLIDGDFNELVSQMDLLIGSTSTTLLETLTRGIPVIVIGSQNGITQNPIPDSVDKRIWRVCYNQEELSNAVEQFLNISDKDQFLKIGENIRNEYFEPVTREGVRRFLKVEEN